MYKTAEAVSPAHPDKLCDQISDLILDEYLIGDPNSRVAVETCGGHGKIFITGEVTSYAQVNHELCAQQVLLDNRYNPSDFEIEVRIVTQSPNIANGVDVGGAGDQGIMVGYATRETEDFIPYELFHARRILRDLWSLSSDVRDSKAQVTTKWDQIETIVVSAERVHNSVILEYLQEEYGHIPDINFIINPAGPWNNGGFESDA